MKFVNDTLAVAWKDLTLLFRDRGNLAVLFLLPLLFSSIIGGPQRAFNSVGEATGGEPAIQIDAYLVNLDSGDYGAQLAQALSQVDILSLEKTSSIDEADRLVAEGERAAAIVIPADFSRAIDNYVPTQIRLIVDPTQEQAYQIVAGMVNSVAAELEVLGEIQYGIRAVLAGAGLLQQLPAEQQAAVQAQTLGVIWTQVEEIRSNPLISIRAEDLEGEEARALPNAFSYITPAFTVMFAFFLVGVVAESLVREKELGSLRRLLTSPMQQGSLIAGKIAGYAVVVFMQVLIMFTVGNVLFDMPLGHSLGGLVVLTLAMALASTSLGMLIGALSKTSRKAGNAGTILGFVLMVLGGCLTSYFILSGEGALYYLSLATPHGHALLGYIELMAFDGRLVSILPHVGVLLGMTAAFFTVAMWRFKFEQ